MLAHVLVPLDGSPLAEEAIGPAKRILSDHGRITLVTAVEMPDLPLYGYDMGVSSATTYQTALDEVAARATSYLETVTTSLQKEGCEVKYIVRFGEPASVIVDLGRDLKVDAIVMSTHGRSGVSRWLFGSITSKVLSIAECPVLVVPGADKQRLLASEGKPAVSAN